MAKPASCLVVDMEALSEHIDERLKTRKFCIVFEQELGRFFPPDEKTSSLRFEAIEKFATERGLEFTICDPGIRVTFRRKRPEPSA
jgi:hypothetical protein